MPESEAVLRARLRDLQSAIADLPPHSAQGLRADLEDQVARLRRRLATRGTGPVS